MWNFDQMRNTLMLWACVCVCVCVRMCVCVWVCERETGSQLTFHNGVFTLHPLLSPLSAFQGAIKAFLHRSYSILTHRHRHRSRGSANFIRTDVRSVKRRLTRVSTDFCMTLQQRTPVGMTKARPNFWWELSLAQKKLLAWDPYNLSVRVWDPN